MYLAIERGGNRRKSLIRVHAIGSINRRAVRLGTAKGKGIGESMLKGTCAAFEVWNGEQYVKKGYEGI